MHWCIHIETFSPPNVWSTDRRCAADGIEINPIVLWKYSVVLFSIVKAYLVPCIISFSRGWQASYSFEGRHRGEVKELMWYVAMHVTKLRNDQPWKSADADRTPAYTPAASVVWEEKRQEQRRLFALIRLFRRKYDPKLHTKLGEDDGNDVLDEEDEDMLVLPH